MNIEGRSLRQQCDFEMKLLELERSTFISHWRELGENILPRRPRFLVTDTNKGDRRNQKIINSTASLAARTLRSGMMGGITSPARPWFKLSTADEDLADFNPVKAWLYDVSNRMSTVFLRSNLYNMLPVVYGDLGVFSTAPMSIEEDFKNVIRCQSFPVGSYVIAKDYAGRINTFGRTFRLTVRQLVEQFGIINDKSNRVDWSNISEHAKDLYERGNYEAWIEVRHLISPNPAFDSKKSQSKFKKFRSVYFERGTSSSSAAANYMSDGDTVLRESGYDYFPILCPRWEVTGEDVYGTDCPGMSALGDIKALQLYERKKAQAIEKMINPAMVAPASMKGQRNSILPGDITFMPEGRGQDEFRPAHNVNLDVNHVIGAVREHEDRIKRCFYEDLFLMLADSDRRQITATEIDERKEEKLLALGPVLEQVNQDLLDPLIDNTFDMMMKKNLLPKPPPELQGQPLRVEYVSVMAQAQKMIGLSSVDHFNQFVGQMSQISPDVRTKINFDEVVNVYGNLTGIPPKIIRSDEDAQAMRAQQQQAQAQAQQAQVAAQQAQSARNLSLAKTDEPSALTQLMEQSQAGQLAPGA
jgi:hypothetical protein